jgi:hypothetical protein
MDTKEEQDRAYKALKKRLKIYQNDAAGSIAPAAHLSGGRAQISAVEPPQGFPPEVWDELVARGRLKKVGRNLYELNRPA